MRIIDSENTKQTKRSAPTADEALFNLFVILETYMGLYPTLSINHLSKKCGVSEPTLRRIKNRQLKRLPSTTNILKLLSHISKRNKISELIDFFPGSLVEFIKESMTQILDNDLNHVTDLTQHLKNPTAYLIYKLSANDTGVTAEKILQLFGMFGEQQVQKLLEKELLRETDNRYFAKHTRFCLAPEVFREHLRATSDFIKPENLTNSPYKYSQMFYNLSSSVNIETYAKILKIQRTAIRKIRDLIFDEKSHGEIPTFIIGAIDSLDNKSAHEISQQKSR